MRASGIKLYYEVGARRWIGILEYREGEGGRSRSVTAVREVGEGADHASALREITDQLTEYARVEGIKFDGPAAQPPGKRNRNARPEEWTLVPVLYRPPFDWARNKVPVDALEAVVDRARQMGWAAW